MKLAVGVSVAFAIGLIASFPIAVLDPERVDAHHVTFVDRNTFVRFMDSSLGSDRAVTTCTNGLDTSVPAKAYFRYAVADWNNAAGFNSFALKGTGEHQGVVSIMESSTIANGMIVSQCGSTFTQPFDYTAVQGAFSAGFGTPPTPQILSVQPVSSSIIRVTFKVPNAGAHQCERTLCGGAYPASQITFAAQGDVRYAHFPQSSNGVMVCGQLRVLGGSGSFGVHYAKQQDSNGHITGLWSHVYSSGSQFILMKNLSTSQSIPATRITPDYIIPNYAQCPLDVQLATQAIRACHLQSTGTGTIFWWKQTGAFTSILVP